MKLICPFTFNVSGVTQKSSRFSRIKFLLQKFYEINKKYHEIELVTDVESHKLLEYIVFDNVRYFDTKPFKLIDDFKIFLLPLLKENEIIVDFDVYLKKPLVVDTKNDLIIERYEEKFAKKIYKDLITQSKVNFNKQYYLNIDNLDAVTNIGVLKINNLELLQLYINTYNNKSLEFIQNAEIQGINYGKYSVLFGQLLLRDIINKNNFSVFDTKTFSGNNYIHLNGDNKYKLTLDQIEKNINSLTLI